MRRLCVELAECSGAGTQHHKLSVRGKTTGWHTVDHHCDSRVSLTVKAVRGENTERVASDPSKFFMPPYMADHGYVGISLDAGEVDREEIREFIVEAYRLAAPKRLAALIN